MIHWQAYYHQNKHLPLNEILTGYHKLLRELQEQSLLEQSHLITQTTPRAATNTLAGPTPAGNSGGGYGANDPLQNMLILSGSYFSISNPTGVYYFTSSTWKVVSSHNAPNLTGLVLYGNQINKLDLVGLTGVKYINLSSNPISSSLDLTSMPNLVTASISGSAVKSLNTTGLNSLYHLSASYNQITSANFNSNKNLTRVDMSFNPSMSVYQHSSGSLSSLLITGSTRYLTSLDVSNNALDQTSVDNLFIHISSSGHTGAGLVVQIHGGSNAPTSSAASAAVTALRSGGATIKHN
jgi:hypothetical protein